MTYRQAGQTITAPDAGGHGLDMSNGQDWLVEDCLIDLSACPLDQLDEAVGVVWGSSAVFRRCVIRGAGKLVLCCLLYTSMRMPGVPMRSCPVTASAIPAAYRAAPRWRS